MTGRRRGQPKEYWAEWRAKNREKVREYARAYHARRKADPAYQDMKNRAGTWTRRKRKYGITKEEYAARLTMQQGTCPICREVRLNDLRVDHDHSTGHIRGLLCDSCNNGLGRFRDDPQRLERAIAYLRGELLPCLGPSISRKASVEVKPGEVGGTLTEAIPSQAAKAEGVTTRAKARRAKRPEAPGTER